MLVIGISFLLIDHIQEMTVLGTIFFVKFLGETQEKVYRQNNICMKKSFLFTIIATIAIVCLFLLSKHLICGNSLEIFFVSSQKHSAQDLNYKGGLNAYEWFIISGHVQKSNLEKEGYHIPDVDFNKNNLIIWLFFNKI